jgi:hypothetical protein
MATIGMEPPLQAEGSESFTMALYNIQRGCNDGLESALRVMKLMGVNFGILLETKNDLGGLHVLEQQLQCPIHPCTKCLARRD